MTSCFVYKVMGLTFYDRINTQLIYIFELAQVVARRITRPQRNFLGSNLTGCSFFQFFFFIFRGRGGGWGVCFYNSLHVFFLSIYFVIIFFSFHHVYLTAKETHIFNIHLIPETLIIFYPK